MGDHDAGGADADAEMVMVMMANKVSPITFEFERWFIIGILSECFRVKYIKYPKIRFYIGFNHLQYTR